MWIVPGMGTTVDVHLFEPKPRPPRVAGHARRTFRATGSGQSGSPCRSVAGTSKSSHTANQTVFGSSPASSAISQAMRADLLASGVKVSEIRPGMVETEFSLVRFHGDRERADRVYDGVTPLTGDDIAEAIAWAAQLPAHMNVNEMVLMPSQQAGAYYTYRKNR